MSKTTASKAPSSRKRENGSLVTKKATQALQEAQLTPLPEGEENKAASQPENEEVKRHRLPNLCDPAKGQLFEDFDKYEEWDDFDNAYKDQILNRFRSDTKNRNHFTQELQNFISRMYRLDGTVTSIIPGKSMQHITEMDFNEAAPRAQYLFHKLRPHGISIINDDNDKKEKDKKSIFEDTTTSKFSQRKKSYQPNASGKMRKMLESGRNSSHSSDHTGTKDGSRLTRHPFHDDHSHQEVFKKKVSRMFKGIELVKPESSESTRQQQAAANKLKLGNSGKNLNKIESKQLYQAPKGGAVAAKKVVKTKKAQSAMRPSMKINTQAVTTINAAHDTSNENASLSRNNTFEHRNVSFAQNNESLKKLRLDTRIDSPKANITREAFLNSNQGRARKIREQKSRSRIRGNLRKNIKTTFSTEGLEIDAEKRAIIARQFDDNRAAFEAKLDQERLKKLNTNIRRVNRSINRLEKQNKNFLNQMVNFRRDRLSVSKVSSTNIRALSGLNSRMMLSSSNADYTQGSNFQRKKSSQQADIQGALGGVSSVLRIGMNMDSKSQLDGTEAGTGMISPAYDRSLNFTRTSKFNEQPSELPDKSKEILVQEQMHAEPYLAAMDVATMLPQIVNNAGLKGSFPSAYRREQVGRNYSNLRSNDSRENRRLAPLNVPDSPNKVVTSRTGKFEISHDYIQRRQQQIESGIYTAKYQPMTVINTQNLLQQHNMAMNHVD